MIKDVKLLLSLPFYSSTEKTRWLTFPLLRIQWIEKFDSLIWKEFYIQNCSNLSRLQPGAATYTFFARDKRCKATPLSSLLPLHFPLENKNLFQYRMKKIATKLLQNDTTLLLKTTHEQYNKIINESAQWRRRIYCTFQKIWGYRVSFIPS